MSHPLPSLYRLASKSTITKYNRLSALKTTEIHFSSFRRLDIWGQGASMIRRGPCSVLHPSHHVLTWWEKLGSPLGPLAQGHQSQLLGLCLIAFKRPHLPALWGLGSQRVNLGSTPTFRPLHHASFLSTYHSRQVFIYQFRFDFLHKNANSGRAGILSDFFPTVPTPLEQHIIGTWPVLVERINEWVNEYFTSLKLPVHENSPGTLIQGPLLIK